MGKTEGQTNKGPESEHPVGHTVSPDREREGKKGGSGRYHSYSQREEEEEEEGNEEVRKSLTHREGVVREMEREEKSERARRREGEHHSANDLNPMNSGGFGGMGGGDGGQAQSSIEEDEECMRAFPPLSLCCPASVPRGDKQGARKQGRQVRRTQTGLRTAEG